MRISDIIIKKRNGEKLSNKEIEFFIKGYTDGTIPDYQASALLMAIYFNGMDGDETLSLTMAMVDSGDTVDLSSINGIKVDKHSTGGVGDKISICLGPMVAACGGSVAKMSGRGLGHTGGTIDKLESISGMRLDLSKEEFIENVNNIGISIVSQTGKIAPADKKLYALRDVTGTVDNLSLIAASIMSKKIASGADSIVLDVKMGSGAFMKSLDDARALAREMVLIGDKAGKDMVALVTNMDEPLGKNIGNSLEVIEAISVLKGKGPTDVLLLSVEIGGFMLLLSGICQTMEDARDKLNEVITNGKALEKLKEMVSAQMGNAEFIDNTDLFNKANISLAVKAINSGYVKHIDSEKIGKAALLLGAGRETKDSEIDLSAGITLLKKVGDFVSEEEDIAILYYNNEKNILEAKSNLLSSYTYSNDKVEPSSLVLDVITKTNI
ncbi:MAG: pyrimidine-nucleoside phosphorylase [Clostridium sp.]